MEGKILINQELPLEVQHFDTCTFISQKYLDTNEEECVYVESKNRRQLALAICPELQSELKKQNEELVELIKMAQNLPAGTSKQSFERYDRFMVRSTEILKQIENTPPKN